MSDEKKEKEVVRVELHNRGLRTWELPGGIVLDPGETESVPEDIAKKFAKDYPRDLILATDLAPTAGNRIKQLEGEKADLEKQVTEQHARIQKLEAEGDAALVQENEDLKKANADLTQKNEKLEEVVSKLKEKIKELKDK